MSEPTAANAARQAIERAEAAAEAGQLIQALAEYSAALDLATGDPAGDAPAADAWRGTAIVCMRLGRWDQALHDASESRGLAAGMNDDRRLALAENLLGAIEFERGNWYEAGLRYGTAREYAGTIGDAPLLLEIENNDGVLWAAQGNRRRAEESFRWALSRFEELERHPFGARVLNNLAMVLAADGRFEEAEALYERALSECKRRSDLALAATVMLNRARLALAVNDVIRAHTLAATARVFSERLEQSPIRADVASVMGAMACTLKNWAEAEESLRFALAQNADDTAPLAQAQLWSELGELYAAQGRKEESREAWLQASQSYQALGASAEAARAEARIAMLGSEGSEPARS